LSERRRRGTEIAFEIKIIYEVGFQRGRTHIWRRRKRR